MALSVKDFEGLSASQIKDLADKALKEAKKGEMAKKWALKQKLQALAKKEGFSLGEINLAHDPDNPPEAKGSAKGVRSDGVEPGDYKIGNTVITVALKGRLSGALQRLLDQGKDLSEYRV